MAYCETCNTDGVIMRLIKGVKRCSECDYLIFLTKLNQLKLFELEPNEPVKDKIFKPPPDNDFLLVAVSGGRSSVRMARHIQTHPKYARYKKLYVFCNTGQEKPETIQFLKDMVYYWGIPLVLLEGVYSLEEGVGVSYKVIDSFDELNMSSEPLKGAIRQMNKYKWTGVFNQAVPYCSDYTKTRVSHAFAKEIFGSTSYTKAIGYRVEDMPKRITWSELQMDKTKIAPLLTDFDLAIGLVDLDAYYDAQPFKLGISSKFDNCEVCHKADEDNIIIRIQNGIREETKNFYRSMENEYGNKFFRGHKSIDDLIMQADNTEPIPLTKYNTNANQCICQF